MNENGGKSRLQEELLRNSDERFRMLLQKVPTMAVQGYDLKGITVYWNHASEKLYGYTEKEAVGRNLLDLIIPPEMHEPVEQAIKQMAETGQAIPAAELSLMKKDGSRVFVYSSHVILSTPKQDPVLFCIDFDLTEQKKAEQAVLEREQFLSTIIDALPVMLFLKDAESLRFVRFNKAGEDILGLKCEELKGKNDYDFFPKEQADFFTSQDRDVLASGKTHDIPEEPIDTPKGRRILHTTKTPLPGADGKPAYLLGLSQDITTRKRAEEELQKTIHKLEQLNRFMMGREMRVLELKKEINRLLEQAGQMPKYKMVSSDTDVPGTGGE